MPTKPDDFLRRIQIGLDWGCRALTLEHLTGRFYILHTGPGTYSNRGYRTYVRAQHELLDLSKDDGGNGHRTCSGCQVNRDYLKEGRLTKTERAAWLADIARFM